MKLEKGIRVNVESPKCYIISLYCNHERKFKSKPEQDFPLVFASPPPHPASSVNIMQSTEEAENKENNIKPNLI